MADRVAVYFDFDNVVISRYDNLHGDSAWRRDDARHHKPDLASDDPVDVRLAEAEVDLGAIIDYAASFGTVAFTRAYADWSVPANAAYRKALVDKAVDLVQMFPASGTKNGADIRLAVDAVEDLARHADITHVALVAGDSDYVPLAQRCKRMGRFVVGIGVAGSTSRALVNASDEFRAYERLPGVSPPPLPQPRSKVEAEAEAETGAETEAETGAGPGTRPAKKAAAKKTAKKSTAKKATSPEPLSPDDEATRLLLRAVRVGLQKSDDEWIYASGVKSQMQRMNPEFNEKSFGFSSFKAFVESRSSVVASRVHDNGQLLIRLA
jgi:uncharacterized protein (TIGR00288 family)